MDAFCKVWGTWVYCCFSLALVCGAQSFSFSNFRDVSNVEATGNAHPAQDQDGGFLLTDKQLASFGAFRYRIPIQFCNTASGYMASFLTTFTFRINKNDTTKVNADGLAFTIAPDKLATSNDTYGRWLGAFSEYTNGDDFNKIVAIEFDTFSNNNITGYPEFNDIDDNHVGLDLHGIRSANMSSLYPVNIHLGSGRTIAAKVDYNAVQQRLLVHVSYEPMSVWKLVLDHNFKLCAYISDQSYVGFSAGSGDANLDYHRMLSWNFSVYHPLTAPPASQPAQYSHHNFTPCKISCGLVAGSLGAVALVAVAVAAWALKRKPKPTTDLVLHPQEMSYRELVTATDNFSEQNLLGRGGFGGVFRGRLPTDKSLVAVKRISETSHQGEREFLAEVTIISQLSHRNLVKLRGWCKHKKVLILVYDYMPGGSVDKLLFESETPLTWGNRLRILRGIAAAMVYLHEDWEQQVVHRDVKLSNVLLDFDSNARLGDFGLARKAEHGLGLATTSFAGTLGYIAPEVGMATRFTAASDTFSFGIMVLEMVCGRRAMASGGLLPWVQERISREKQSEVIDSRFDESEQEQAYYALQIGLACTEAEAERRPSMRQVLTCLHGMETAV